MNILHGQLAAVVRRRDAAQININLFIRPTGARPLLWCEYTDVAHSDDNIFSSFLVKNNKIMKLICNRVAPAITAPRPQPRLDPRPLRSSGCNRPLPRHPRSLRLDP